MARQRLNHDDAFKSIMGKTINATDTEENGEMAPNNKVAATREELVQAAFYITRRQRKALKMKTALGDKLEDKDLSSIVRAALDVYLADILANL